jgi:hypothetical protein
MKLTMKDTCKAVLFILALTGLVGLIPGTEMAGGTTSVQAAAKVDAITFECFNGHVYFSSQSTNAPALSSDNCGQVIADLLGEGFVLQAHNTVNFGAVFVYVRGGGSDHGKNQD